MKEIFIGDSEKIIKGILRINEEKKNITDISNFLSVPSGMYRLQRGEYAYYF